MTPPDVLQRMFAHMAWADTRTLAALRAMHEPHSQALDLFSHMLAAEHVWLRRIEGAPAAYEVWPSLSLDECERLAHANERGYAAVLARENRREILAYRTTTGVPHETPLDDILIHVSHHGMYHRGQIALMIRTSGGTPISTDYIVFYRDQLEQGPSA
jgi:uncharacterized damage-inducible protein DinB